MIKTETIIPTSDNDSVAFSRSAWRTLEGRLLEVGGGFTREPVMGGWADSTGRVYTDRSRRYTVALESWRDLGAWLAVVEWAVVTFRQEALYIEVAGVPEIITEPD